MKCSKKDQKNHETTINQQVLNLTTKIKNNCL
jgi:hypothetical protein